MKVRGKATVRAHLRVKEVSYSGIMTHVISSRRGTDAPREED